MATITIAELLKKELNLSFDAVENGFEVVKTPSSIKIQLRGKTVTNLKVKDGISYTIFEGFEYEIDFEDENNEYYYEEHADEIKTYVVVQDGFALYFN